MAVGGGGWGGGGGEGPWFVWVHLFDPHAPYRPPPPFDAQYANRPYDGEVAAVDAALAPLLETVRASARPTLIVVTGDHGEGLGDHGELTHGLFAYEATLRVPLIIADVGGSGGAAAAGGGGVSTHARSAGSRAAGGGGGRRRPAACARLRVEQHARQGPLYRGRRSEAARRSRSRRPRRRRSRRREAAW